MWKHGAQADTNKIGATVRPSLWAAALLAASLISGCAPMARMYSVPGPDWPTATLLFKETEPLSDGVGAYVGWTDDAYQANSIDMKVGRPDFWGPRHTEDTVQVEAGRPMYLQVVTYFDGASCRNFVTFTAEVGKTYVVEQDISFPLSCLIRIIDQATGQTPQGARYFAPKNWEPYLAPGKRAPTYEGPL